MVQTSSIIFAVAVVAEEVISSNATWVGISQPAYYGSECPLASGAVSVGQLVDCENVCDATTGCNAINLEALGAANTCSPLSCPGTAYLAPSLVNTPTGPNTYAYYRVGAPTPVPPTPGPAPTPSVPSDPSCTAPMLCKIPNNCYHAQWAVPCSQAADVYACTASAGVWCWKTMAEHADNSTFSSDGASVWAMHSLAGSSSSDGEASDIEEVDVQYPNCTPPNNCYHSQWAVPCSDAADEYACVQSGGVWEGSPSPPPPPPPTPSPYSCNPPDNCYHTGWAVPCSDAADQYACQQSGGLWVGGAFMQVV